MSKEIALPFRMTNGGSMDERRGPYSSVGAACAAIPNAIGDNGLNLRAGKIVDIGTHTNSVEHRWIGGYADANLQPVNKDRDAGISNAQSTANTALSNAAAAQSAALTAQATADVAQEDIDGLEIIVSDLDSNALKLASESKVDKKAIAHKPGTYTLVAEDVTSFPNAGGYINWGTGVVVPGGSNAYSNFIPIAENRNAVRIKMPVSGAAGGAFYNASGQYLSGMIGTNQVTDYPKPAGATQFKVTRGSEMTLLEAKTEVVKTEVVSANQLGFIDTGVLTKFDIVLFADILNYLTAGHFSKLGVLNELIGNNTILFEEGLFYKEKVSYVNYPNVGRININTGAYEASANPQRATGLVDISGYSHIIAIGPVISSTAGTAFYTSAEVFVAGSGKVNTGAEQLIARPATAKYVRACGTTAAPTYLWLINFTENGIDELSFYRNGEKTTFKIKQDALQFAKTTAVIDTGITYKPGSYVLAGEDVTSFPNAGGYINYSTGAVVTGGSNSYSDFLPIGADRNTVRIKMPASGAAGGAFYNDADQWLGAMIGTDAVADYPKPAGATKFKVTKGSALTLLEAKTEVLQLGVVEANQVGFIENGEITTINILLLTDIINYLTSGRYSKLGTVGQLIGNDTILFEPGTFFLDRVQHLSYPNVGYINITTGAYVASVNPRRATDFIDITNYSHIIAMGPVISSVIGTAFYTAAQAFVAGSGFVNTGVEQLIAKPATAKYVRASGSTSAPTYLFLINFTENGIDQLTFYRNGQKTTFDLKPKALEFSIPGDVKPYSIAVTPGDYDIVEVDFNLADMIPGFVNYSSGSFTASGSAKVNNHYNIEEFTHVILSGLDPTSGAGIVFYDEAGVRTDGFQHKAAKNTEYAYEIPYRDRTKTVRASMMNDATHKVLRFVKRMTLVEGQLGLIDGETFKIFTGSGGSFVPGDEVFKDIPVSETGAEVQVDDMYIQPSTGIMRRRMT